MRRRQSKITVVLPAYNAARTLRKTLADIPKEWVDDIILVDDASTDGTAEIARKLNLEVVVHPSNRGYGGNQKTCYRTALARGADIVVMIHPDHQYDPKAIPALIVPLLEKRADAVFGSRMMVRKNALRGGMPVWKFLGNIFLTTLANIRLGLHLTEYHSGFRAYCSQVLERLPVEENSDGFVFDMEIIVQLKQNDFRIMEVPIQTYYFNEASSVNFYGSVKYGLSILHLLLKYRSSAK